MELNFLTEWPRKVYSNDDHYSFNIKIVDEVSVDSTVMYRIYSKVGKDSATIPAKRAKDSSYHSSVFVEGSVQHGELKVGWLDTIICTYKNVSDTVFHENLLGIKAAALGFPKKADENLFDVMGRALNEEAYRITSHKIMNSKGKNQ